MPIVEMRRTIKGMNIEDLVYILDKQFNPWYKKVARKLFGWENFEIVVPKPSEWIDDKPCPVCGLNMGGMHVREYVCARDLGGCGYNEELEEIEFGLDKTNKSEDT